MGGIYIAAGGKTVLGVPDWAKVIFYPGFLAGDWFYGNIFSSMKPAHIFGLLAVGITYGLLFQAIYFIKKVLLGK